MRSSMSKSVCGECGTKVFEAKDVIQHFARTADLGFFGLLIGHLLSLDCFVSQGVREFLPSHLFVTDAGVSFDAPL